MLAILKNMIQINDLQGHIRRYNYKITDYFRVLLHWKDYASYKLLPISMRKRLECVKDIDKYSLNKPRAVDNGLVVLLCMFVSLQLDCGVFDRPVFYFEDRLGLLI